LNDLIINAIFSKSRNDYPLFVLYIYIILVLPKFTYSRDMKIAIGLLVLNIISNIITASL